MSKPPSYRDMLASGVVGKSNFYRVRLDELHVEPGFNLRIEDDSFKQSIEELAAYIFDGGTYPPIEVRIRPEGGLYVVDGHRRRLAIRRAVELGAPLADDKGIVWVDTRHFEGNDADRIARIMTSAEGRALSPLETSAGYKRLSALGWEPERIAKKVGKSRPHVEGLLILANANTDAQQMVADGTVSAALAIEAIRKHGEKAGAFLAGQLTKAKAEGKSKVTAGTLKPKALPRAVVEDLFANARDFRAKLSPEAQRTVAEFEAGTITEGKVEIDAEALFMLIATIVDAEKAQALQEEKARAKADQAKQGELDTDAAE